MKKLICLTALFFTLPSFAQQLHNYDQIKAAISQGKLIRIYVDYTKCSMTAGSSMVGNHDAVYTPNAMAITNDGDISSYILYFTLSDPRYPLKPVYQYGQYAIAKDSHLEIRFTTLNAADYIPLGNSSVINCKMDIGVKVFDNQ